METVKEMPKVKDNGEKPKATKTEMIEKVERKLEQIKSEFHHWSGYLACLKEDN